MKYILNRDAAIASCGAGRITKTGAYVGQFSRAEAVESKYGTKGIEFTFVDEHGNTADFLSVWTVKENGEEIFGYRLIMGLMTCLKIREMNKTFGNVNKFDSASGQQKQTRAEVYPSLMNKDIGVILQAEEYITRDGETKQKMNIVNFFEPETELMASEILKGETTPVLMQKITSNLADVKKAKESNKPVNTTHVSSDSNLSDDDIPF